MDTGGDRHGILVRDLRNTTYAIVRRRYPIDSERVTDITVRQRRRIQMLIQDLYAQIECLGEVVLQAGSDRPKIEVVVTAGGTRG